MFTNFTSQIWQNFNYSGTVSANFIWYRRTKDLVSLLDPEDKLFLNSLVMVLAPLNWFFALAKSVHFFPILKTLYKHYYLWDVFEPVVTLLGNPQRRYFLSGRQFTPIPDQWAGHHQKFFFGSTQLLLFSVYLVGFGMETLYSKL